FRLQAFILTPGSGLLAILTVDILNIMGPSIVATILLWGAVGRRAPATAVFGVFAAAIAMLTPLVRNAAWVTTLPVWFQWYLRPAGVHTTFTLFPWSGFVFAGAAAGMLIAPAKTKREEGRVQLALAGSGALLILVGFYTATL